MASCTPGEVRKRGKSSEFRVQGSEWEKAQSSKLAARSLFRHSRIVVQGSEFSVQSSEFSVQFRYKCVFVLQFGNCRGQKPAGTFFHFIVGDKWLLE